jgi:hypothetical protein
MPVHGRTIIAFALLAGLSCAGCGSGSSSAAGGSSPTVTAAVATSAPSTTTSPATSAPATTTSPATSSAAGSTAPATSAAPSPTASGLDVSALCIDPTEYKSVVNYKAGHDTVEALVVGTGKVGIVLAHQSGQDLCEWEPYAYSLAKKGYRAITFSFGTDLVADVVGAAAELRSKGATRVILVGASMGGTTVVAAAPKIKPAVAAVVDLSGPAEYEGVNSIEAAPKLTMPAMFVASKDDQPFVDDIGIVYATATRSPGRKLLIRDGYEHGVDMVKGSTQTAIEAFLRAHAGKG